MRNEDNRVLEAIEEAIRIGRHSGARLQISHLKSSYKVNWYKNEITLKMLDDAIAEGMEVHADRYPYIAYQTGLANLFPLWSRDGGTEQFMARLKDRTILERIRPETLKQDQRTRFMGFRDDHIHKSRSTQVHISERPSDRSHTQLNVDPFEFSVDLMLKENGSVGMVGFGMDEEGTETILKLEEYHRLIGRRCIFPCVEVESTSPHVRNISPRHRLLSEGTEHLFTARDDPQDDLDAGAEDRTKGPG
jgi:N-acyl-D-amino-acid deacylase